MTQQRVLIADDEPLARERLGRMIDELEGYQVVAEGVEDDVTASLLRDMGCDMIQGYLLTPPLPFDELLEWLERSQQQPERRKLG